MPSDTACVLVAGGCGDRFGGPKQFAPLLGRPVMAYSLMAYEEAACVDRIVIVAPNDRLAEARAIAQRFAATKTRDEDVVAGGAVRHDSSYRGLRHLVDGAGATGTPAFVHMHDANRPLLTAAVIEQVHRLGVAAGSAALGAQVRETLGIVASPPTLDAVPDRAKFWELLTPHVYRFGLIWQAHLKAREAGIEVSSDIALIPQFTDLRPTLFGCGPEHFKITYANDLLFAESILRNRGWRCLAQATPTRA